ncbi:exodeoxyribonuclease-3 [Actinoplanes lutulentus]|uniref:Exodeoxyribonuclease-3 n=1 Tax=Actinoplanes lutulentus TaxID=1287878 RepID=A0A327ZDN1_9ACTN|nr:endonuclease/exonuclease/phosphatase family protein [Actinoplanes lutulentus]MBB2942671.1 exodeoxyribonuclease-3 [Actinoplanes lutulentus]RAK38252.1 exodeoxyribonuclease-3 [Actinoplanes lutulentus]
MRFMTWNIRTGGGDRLPAIIDVIKAERPDILAVQELRDFHRYAGKRLRHFAGSVGMTPHLARSVLGQPVAVLVRPPLVIIGRSTVRWRLHHAAASVVLSTPAGPLTVVSTHLNPFSPYRRMREARWLAARYAPSRGMVLIAGDLNGLAPGEDHTEGLAGLAPLYHRRHVNAAGEADTRAVGAFLSAGFADLGLGAGPTVPTPGLGGKEFGPMRLDHVLASPPLAAVARDLRVIRGGAADSASDHFPVRVNLDLVPR